MTVLLVDDHDATRTVCAEELRALGIGVQEAASAQAALGLAHAQRPSAVIVAYPMALRGGRTLTLALRSDPSLNEIVIVAHSRWGWRRTRERAVADGCDAFFEVPTPVTTIVGEIRRRLRQWRVAGARLSPVQARGFTAATVG